MKEVRCNFKNVTVQDKAKFKDACCLLTISVGQEGHEGERFNATMKLIHSSFSFCTITLHDSLQRFTMALGENRGPAHFEEDASLLGEQWLKRVDIYYAAFKKKIKVIRWSDWLQNKYYAEKKALIESTIESDPRYKVIFDETIKGYLAKHCQRLKASSGFDSQRAYKICLEYLIEECAVLCLFPQEKCEYEVYTGKHNAAMIETRHRFVEPNLVKPLVLGFNARRDLQPQSFEVMTGMKQELYA